MSTTKSSNKDYYDGWSGLAKEMANHCKVTHSQCKDCLNKIGTSKCKIFGERPDKYSSPLAKVSCPKRKVK